MEKELKMTDKDFEELEKEKKLILQERIVWHKKYLEWLEKTPNKVWAKQQNKLLNK